MTSLKTLEEKLKQEVIQRQIEIKRHENRDGLMEERLEKYRQELQHEMEMKIENVKLNMKIDAEEQGKMKVMELKYEKQKLIKTCKELQKRLLKLNKIEDKFKAKINISNDENELNDTEQEGKVIGMGDNIYSDYHETGRYIERLRAGTRIKLIHDNKIEINGHNTGLMVQIKYGANKRGWIALHNTSFIQHALKPR